ncbi:MAG: PIG-L family deacetylase [Phenylobacterium sp.]|uniref:PIG-L deacetylase family protein n=1 Tax=Phenylobacterium sp. TaxID=1871053 RepID=UPI001220414A|nr:PIG-L family deacetylase [Phenylobacterium sp.]TAJ68594.1 MAG: PIG-L family deacetylase [Phenylobacterium sp.]
MATILAVHAHPDDVEILMGGTLALMAGRGHTIRIVTATAGEGGSAEFDPAETGRIRQAEAAASAARIGADYRCLGFPDLGVFNDDASRRAVTELVRWARPDVVITGSLADYHPDHEAVSLLVRDACFAAPVANYRTGPAAALDAIPALYFTDAIGGRDRDGARLKRDFAVDIGATFATKRAMLAEHRSQQAWVLRQHGIADLGADMEAWSRRVGSDFGVELAEGFRQYRHPPYPKAAALQDLVGEALLANP